MKFLELLVNFVLIYLAFGAAFYCFMAFQGFWKAQNMLPRIIYSIFWPVSIASIYIAIKKRKEAED
jgi:hypothetical protein